MSKHHHHDSACHSCSHHHHKQETEHSCSCAACGHDHHKEEAEHGCSCAACSGAEPETGFRELFPVVIAALMTAASFLLPQEWMRVILLAAAALLVGWKMFWEGLRGLLRFSLDEMTLMTIAVVAAFLIGEGLEGAMVTILFHIGELIEARAVRSGRKRIDALLSIVPETANCFDSSGILQTVSAKEVEIGSSILIRAGERVPLDCTVVSGTSEADTSAVTGESQPMAVEPGSLLLSGMINLSGSLTCRTTQDYSGSTASRIAQLVREATQQKGKTERFITRFSKIYTPIVVALALILATIPPLAGLGSFTVWVHRALIFLVASCPCALVISIPMTFYNIISSASRCGALIKGSRHIETLAKIRQIVFDKTGTLTTGKLKVSGIIPLRPIEPEKLLRTAAICESGSVHPIAQAVREAAGSVPQPDSAEEIPGKGIRAISGGVCYSCGSARMMEEAGFSAASLPKASLYLADENGILGCIKTSDQIRPEAAQAIAGLQKTGIQHTVMLTGDHAEAAQQVQEELGLSDIRAGLLPQDKVSVMRELRESHGITAFVGDGINDGPVLAAADIGFAMGMGSDLAAQAADVVLMSNSLRSISRSIRAARQGLRIARQNLTFILAVKAIVLILGALGYAPMWSAVFADVGVCVLTVLNAMRAGISPKDE